MLADASGATHPLAAQIGTVTVGAVLVACVLVSALETVVLPRNSFTRISRATFAVVNRILVHDGPNRARSTHRRGLYAPSGAPWTDDAMRLFVGGVSEVDVRHSQPNPKGPHDKLD